MFGKINTDNTNSLLQTIQDIPPNYIDILEKVIVSFKEAITLETDNELELTKTYEKNQKNMKKRK